VGVALDPQKLEETRRSVRRYLDALPDDEPVDLVFLASVLQNFDPKRPAPQWLIVVGAPGTGKTKLIEMIAGWRPVYYMPSGLSSGFFLSTRKEVKDPALKRIKRDGKRILLWPDITSLTSINRSYADGIHNQLIAVHDGRLYRESGMTGEAIEVTFAPEERLGFIAAGTPSWYDFQRRNNAIGTRFSIYYWPTPAWSSTKDLEIITREDDGHHGARYAEAARVVQQYLEYAIGSINDLQNVTLAEPQRQRIIALVALVNRSITTPDTAGDTGKRLAVRAAHLARTIAWMHGRSQPNEPDIQIVLRFVLSQCPPEEQGVITHFARAGTDTHATIDRIIEESSSTRRIVTRTVKDLSELGVVNLSRGRTRSIELTHQAKAFIDQSGILSRQRKPMKTKA
jgi:hypothetical protein